MERKEASAQRCLRPAVTLHKIGVGGLSHFAARIPSGFPWGRKGIGLLFGLVDFEGTAFPKKVQKRAAIYWATGVGKLVVSDIGRLHEHTHPPSKTRITRSWTLWLNAKKKPIDGV